MFFKLTVGAKLEAEPAEGDLEISLTFTDFFNRRSSWMACCNEFKMHIENKFQTKPLFDKCFFLVIIPVNETHFQFSYLEILFFSMLTLIEVTVWFKRNPD